MFGYVRPHKQELLVREFEQYKGAYCQLCRQLGKDYGWTARLTLSYDCTFYALLALSREDGQKRLRRGRCVVNPLKACKFVEAEGEAYHKAAALSILLTCQKLRDNVGDDSFWKAQGCRVLLAFLARKEKKAAARYPLLAQAAEAATRAQREAEQARAGVDACAEPTAQLLAAVFRELGGCDKGQCLALERFGYFLGRWVYLMDAADDLGKDLKEGSFNPFAARLGLEGKKELTEEERKAAPGLSPHRPGGLRSYSGERGGKGPAPGAAGDPVFACAGPQGSAGTEENVTKTRASVSNQGKSKRR